MTVHRYPKRALFGDYARAGVGLAVTGGPLLFVSAGPVMIGILGGLGVLFFIFGLRTWLRQQTCVQVSDEGINTLSSGAPAPRIDLPWNQLIEFNLRYYSTRRDRGDGWLQMLLKSDVAKLRLDSDLQAFDTVVRRVAAAALTNKLSLNQATRTNLDALGIVVPAVDDETTMAVGRGSR